MHQNASRKSGLAVSEIHAVESASQATDVRLHGFATNAKSRSVESPDQGERPKCANDQRTSHLVPVHDCRISSQTGVKPLPKTSVNLQH